MQSPIEVDPLPQRIFLKAHIKHLKKEIHQTKKKLKKVEDEFQKFKKKYSKAIIEITRLHQAHKRDFMDYINKKHHLKEELKEIKRHAGEKS